MGNFVVQDPVLLSYTSLEYKLEATDVSLSVPDLPYQWPDPQSEYIFEFTQATIPIPSSKLYFALRSGLGKVSQLINEGRGTEQLPTGCWIHFAPSITVGIFRNSTARPLTYDDARMVLRGLILFYLNEQWQVAVVYNLWRVPDERAGKGFIRYIHVGTAEEDIKNW